ncbi:hypothetical protein J2792_004135 [Novosphingobium capsulatum]|uniref:Phosphoenolpyruvate carboxykinase n=1 Tax=Novosphingobium capsulatum TaxID=13688 RepID=A0ABU1MT74_9SPHN|nr:MULTISPECIES: hypothetical protein [Novosphingobium]MDR6513242.1 hypothetical protein [Novosphingobium capsulatum]PTR05906.1 hypothetical protein C8K11_12421 [Novosphingobium sp. GV055]PUA94408.1 hypothetical protein C8K12_12421 [Novosphingobium sp. GV061]PUB12870.1 hypothetical protein C8K14_12421 [Novosphingobium sp. GV079]PUB38136.1 hypothetical protein C8K10_12421 [Novosphingobium sp. GV027]
MTNLPNKGAAKARVARILDANDKELMAIRKIEADGNTLVIRGKIFGAMPMVARLTPAEARAALRLLDLRTVLFLLTLLFRRN